MSSTRAVRGTGFNVFARVRAVIAGGSRSGFACEPFAGLDWAASGLGEGGLLVSGFDGADLVAGTASAGSASISFARAAGFFAVTASCARAGIEGVGLGCGLSAGRALAELGPEDAILSTRATSLVLGAALADGSAGVDFAGA